jgi:fructuronate reductase
MKSGLQQTPQLGTGIVHFGPGAFHRAHQAEYVDRLLAHDRRWGIAAVSLRSRGTIDALSSQHGCYTLAIFDEQTSFRRIAVHTRFLGPNDKDSIRQQLADPAIRIVTSTVTEKGYCLAADGSLDFAHPDIVHDLSKPGRPVSLPGWLALGFADRRANGLPPFTPICCDNMASNGTKLGNAVAAFAQCLDPELARWIRESVQFPNTVVDSITPATDDQLRNLVREATGCDDWIPVSREAYAQWVIDDVLPRGSPDLASIGVVLSADVGAWAKAKLRILNGAHSALAYVGLLMGHETVADAMRDPSLSTFVERLVRESIIPVLQPSPIDLDRYADETFARLRNPAIHHRLSQIAWDGSQKLPYRLLDTIIGAPASARAMSLLLPVAAWILFLERQARSGKPIVDPLANRLEAAARSEDSVDRIVNLRQVFPERLASDPGFVGAIKDIAATMRDQGIAAALAIFG